METIKKMFSIRELCSSAGVSYARFYNALRYETSSKLTQDEKDRLMKTASLLVIDLKEFLS